MWFSLLRKVFADGEDNTWVIVDVDVDVSICNSDEDNTWVLVDVDVDVDGDVNGDDFFSLVLFCRPWRSALKLDVIQPESC